MNLHAEQIRAAHSLLGWSQTELAKYAKVGSIIMRRFETGHGPVRGTIESLVRVQSALERAQIHFIAADEFGSVWVRFVQKPKAMK